MQVDTPAKKIINKFGGLSKMTKAMRYKYVSRVQGWRNRGIIPSKVQKDVLKVARKLGLDIKPEDFF